MERLRLVTSPSLEVEVVRERVRIGARSLVAGGGKSDERSSGKLKLQKLIMMRGATLIIAEAGVNHNGSIKAAGQLIEAAAEAGADLVKFQTFSADRLVTGSASKADYQLEITSTRESQHEMIRKLELSREMHEELIAYCKKCGVGFFSHRI